MSLRRFLPAVSLVPLCILVCACDPASTAILNATLDDDEDASIRTRDAEPDAEPDLDPILCGGAYEWPCASDKYCRVDTGCGTVGNCFTRGAVCRITTPVCGCDGKTYENECAASKLGISYNHEGSCAPPTQQFQCGRFTCDTGYCLDNGRDEASARERYFCIPFPAGCTGCDCPAKLGLGCYIGSTCSEQDGHTRVTCKIPSR